MWRKDFRGAWPKEFNARDFVLAPHDDRSRRKNSQADYTEPMRAIEDGPIITTGYVVGPDPKTDRERPSHPVWVVDPRTGTAAKPWQGKALRETYRVGTTLIDVPHSFTASKSGCTGELRAYDLHTGQIRWQRTASAKHLLNRGDVRCDNFRPALSGTALLMLSADERPLIVDVTTGTVRWQGPRGDHPLGIEGDIVVLRKDNGAGGLAGVDVTSGRTLWTATLPAGPRGGQDPFSLREFAVAGDSMIFTGLQRFSDGFANTLTVLDLRTGEEKWVARRKNLLLGAGDDWVVSAAGDTGTAPTIELFEK